MARRSLIRAVLGAAVVGVLLVALAPPAQAAPALGLVPYRMDASNQAGWWRPVDEYNGHLYVAYNAWGGPGPTNGGATDTHTIYIARRAPDGTWTRGCLQAADGSCVVYGDDIGHNQPSIAIDGDGYIHAFVSMHNHNWRYYRSTAPADVTTMVNRSSQMPDQGERYTYPNLAIGPGGDVYLIIRAFTGYPNTGQGRLYRWNNASNSWSRVAIFASQTNFVVYPDDVASFNGEVHIAWEWAYGGASGLRHFGSYLVYNPATGQFRNAAGTPVSVPVTTGSPVVYQPLGANEQLSCTQPSTCPGVQSAKFAIDQTTGRPVVAYRYRSNNGYPYRVWLAQWTGSSWQRQLVYGGNYDTYAAIDVTSFGGGVRVYYAKANTLAGTQAFVATRQSNGGWAETAMLPGVRIERLSVIRRGGTDYLYLAAPGLRELYAGTNSW